jgi:hypothetical protein
MKLIKRLKRRIFLITADSLAKALQKQFKKFAKVRISLNPTSYEYLQLTKKSKINNAEWTIVIQGPILNSIHLGYFTSNLRIIRENFSGAKIIISTYTQYQSQIDLIPGKYFDKLIVSNENEYQNNFERQVASTHLGLMSAKLYNRKYVLKMRTDQMIYHPGALRLFEIMLKTYGKSGSKDQNNLVASSLNSWLYRPFGASDMLMAGYLLDMQAYWNYDDQIKSFKLKLPNNSKLIANNILFYESFLAKRYLITKGFKFTGDDFHDTARMYKEHLIIIDSMSVSHSWFKRSPVWNGNSIIKSGYTLPSNALIEISHSDWLCFKFDTHTIKEDHSAARH